MNADRPSSYKYFEVTHGIFRLFMAPVSSILFPFKSVWSVSETVCSDSHLSSYQGTIQKSFPLSLNIGLDELYFFLPSFFKFILRVKGWEGGFTSSQYNLI